MVDDASAAGRRRTGSVWDWSRGHRVRFVTTVVATAVSAAVTAAVGCVARKTAATTTTAAATDTPTGGAGRFSW